LDSSKLKIRQARLHEMSPKPPSSQLVFGKVFTDHMLTVDWTRDSGWHDPEIRPFENFSIHPGSKVSLRNITMKHLWYRSG
jgi:branched-chain amino acid aminotransferase